jgi:hypothetical protein
MFWNNDIAEGIAVFIIFLGLSSPVIIIGLIYYLKKRLEHKQILAAIEKGTSLAELKPVKPTGPLWIKNLTAGIAIVWILLSCINPFCFRHRPPHPRPFAAKNRKTTTNLKRQHPRLRLTQQTFHKQPVNKNRACFAATRLDLRVSLKSFLKKTKKLAFLWYLC